MNRRFVAGMATLAIAGSVLVGCKNKTPENEAPQQKAQTSAQAPATAPAVEAKSGEELFKQHCAVCHPAGENTINPKKTLHSKDLEKSGVTTTDDVIGKMRNPGPGMTKFDEKTIPDKDAKDIAEYVLNTFK